MEESKVGGYISSIQFNNGQSVEISANDIVIFVGPNNAGKSQSLRDIYDISGNKKTGVIIDDVTVKKYNGELQSLLDSIGEKTVRSGHISYELLGQYYSISNNAQDYFLRLDYYSEFRDLFIANIDTTTRLINCVPVQSIPRNSAKQHPIHYASFDKNYRKWLSDSFKKAFGFELIPNTFFGSQIPLCIGEPVNLTGAFEDEQDRSEAYAEVLEKYKQVQDQGDGIKSFTGILLYLMLDYYCTYLIDEPESFLHPPQARIMGQIIGSTLSDQQQAFIATHSEDIIKGFMETCPDRLKIIRITRDGDTNHFSVLNNESFTTVWNDPLLKYSNIMSSLFHKTVVLCEGDADCQMYSIIENHIKNKQDRYSEALFIYCGGKQRMARVIEALLSLNVDVKLIPDLDVLNNEVIIKGIVEAYGVEWEPLQADYKTIIANLYSPTETIRRKSTKDSIMQILDASNNEYLSLEEVDEIKGTVKSLSKWENIKKLGIPAIPAGDATAAFSRLNQKLINIGIHLVPVGEIEGFIKEVGGHGQRWVTNVLEKYPDLNNEVYSKIIGFVKELAL